MKISANLESLSTWCRQRAPSSRLRWSLGAESSRGCQPFSKLACTTQRSSKRQGSSRTTQDFSPSSLSWKAPTRSTIRVMLVQPAASMRRHTVAGATSVATTQSGTLKASTTPSWPKLSGRAPMSKRTSGFVNTKSNLCKILSHAYLKRKTMLMRSLQLMKCFDLTQIIRLLCGGGQRRYQCQSTRVLRIMRTR